ncbi:hypothetical protein [Halobacterium sp. KA-4]|uniref:hypothetical protein n=1 Tax=Halobacterium sp. KA-4 TaxID=2896367 RepID=UPI003FA61447
MTSTNQVSKSNSDCPLCGSESSVHPEYSLKGVCANCGFVTDNDVEQHTQSQEILAESGTELDSWKDYSPIHNATEKRFTAAIDIQNQVGDDLGLDAQARIRCAELLGQGVVEGITDGRSTDSVSLAALYWGERQADQPVPISVIANISGTPRSDLTKAINTLQNSLGIPATPTQPVDYVPYLSRQLNIEYKEKVALVELLRRVEADRDSCGSNPVGVVAAGAYHILEGERTQAEICQVAGVSTETLRVRLSELQELSRNVD